MPLMPPNTFTVTLPVDRLLDLRLAVAAAMRDYPEELIVATDEELDDDDEAREVQCHYRALAVLLQQLLAAEDR